MGGILFGAATRQRLAEPVQFAERIGLSGSFLVWSIFGALFEGALLTDNFSPQPILYAILSLTVIRMLPVAIALTGTHLRPTTLAFMGWFGPRGLASVVFTLLALEEIEPGGWWDTPETATWTILLSVISHGISASPLAARYGASIAKAGDIPEKAPAGEPQIRLRDLGGRHPNEGGLRYLIAESDQALGQPHGSAQGSAASEPSQLSRGIMGSRVPPSGPRAPAHNDLERVTRIELA